MINDVLGGKVYDANKVKPLFLQFLHEIAMINAVPLQSYDYVKGYNNC